MDPTSTVSPSALAQPKPPPRRNRALRDWLAMAIACAIVFFARASLADHYVVPSGSMLPTVQQGDRVLVHKAAYGLRIPLTHVWLTSGDSPARGDVVVLDSPESGILLLKRVVALPGDLVAVRSGKLLLNGAPARLDSEGAGVMETLDRGPHRVWLGDGGPDFGPARVPEGHFLMLGDNRGNSHDGRAFGWVSREAIVGRVERVYWRDGGFAWIPL